VATQQAQPVPDDVDLWIAEVGEDGVVAAVEDARRGFADGSIPAFSDMGALREHLTRHAPA